MRPDEAPRILRISRPFIFQKRGIEFAAGLIRDGDDLVVSYGVDDKTAWLMRTSLNSVMEFLDQ